MHFAHLKTLARTALLLSLVALLGCQPSGTSSDSAPASTDAAGDTPSAAETEATRETTGDRLVVYTSRQPHLVEPLFQRFERDTGIVVEFISDDAGALVERLAAERENSPADVLITVDAGNLWQAA
ncbi:MAG: hypothetical protein ACPGJE_09530, partial [Wenzhouxiangellaceae bacterium]